jgi:hypothetical protein
MSKSPFRDKQEAAFYSEFGRALALWAVLESALCDWFIRVTKMRPDMATDVFYSARNFVGRSEMLEAAMGATKLPSIEERLLKAAIRKAVAYNSFRNSLAHGRTIHRFSRGEDGRPVRGQWLLVPGQSKFSPRTHGHSIEAIRNAAKNFSELASLLSEAYYHLEFAWQNDIEFLSPEECLERVHALPNQADLATPSRRQLGRQRQRQAAQKKAPQ